jgi:hypothetical protein
MKVGARTLAGLVALTVSPSARVFHLRSETPTAKTVGATILSCGRDFTESAAFVSTSGTFYWNV